MSYSGIVGPGSEALFKPTGSILLMSVGYSRGPVRVIVFEHLDLLFLMSS